MEQWEGKSKKKIIDGLSGMFQDKNEGPAEEPPRDKPVRQHSAPPPAPEPEIPKIPEEPAVEPPVAKDPPQEPRRRKWYFKPLPIMLIAVIVPAAIGFGALARFKLHSFQAPKEKPVTMVTKPVSASRHQQTLRFLVVAEQKNLVALDIEFNFMNSDRYENFEKEMVEFRDAVYSYLLQQRPSVQNKTSWQPILEDGLLEYVKLAQPRSWADWIHLHGVNVY